ncbi:MAG: NifB/NifX family molybdenum-iron cluster-binding protein [Candidatus Caldatribacteriaceae bacterium]
MKKRIIIPTLDEEGLKAKISEHFGRAPYWTIVDRDGNGVVLGVEVIANSGEHFGGRGHAAEQILVHNPQVVIVRGIGSSAIQRLREANVILLHTEEATVEEALSAYGEGRLVDINSGCCAH